MSVFGQQSLTLTEMAKQLGHSDHSLKAQYRGSAAMDSSITAESWLPGTTGVHCNVTHGDHWEEVKGATTVKIQDNMHIRVGGDTIDTYDGNVTKTFNGRTTNNYFEHSDSNYFALQTTYNTKVWKTTSHRVLEAGTFKGSAYGATLSVTHTAAAFTDLNVKVNSVAEFTCGLKTFNLTERLYSLLGWETEAKVAQKKAAVLKEEIGALSSKIQSNRASLGLLAYKCRAAGIHTGPILTPYPNS